MLDFLPKAQFLQMSNELAPLAWKEAESSQTSRDWGFLL